MSAFSERALSYFAEHGVEPEVAERCGVREEGGWLLYPPSGRKRSLNGQGHTRQPKGSALASWWPRGAPAKHGDIILVCEGESDSLAAVSALMGSPEDAGLRTLPVCAVPGTGYPVARLVDELVEHAPKEVVLALDGDEAGRSYTTRATDALHERGLTVAPVELEDGEDLASYLARLPVERRGEWIANALYDAERARPPVSEPQEAAEDAPAPKSRTTVEPPETAEALAAVSGLISKYVVLPTEHEAVAVALWVLHTWAVDGAHATPYLLVTSPERRSGKSRLLEVLELLVRSPWRIASASEAAMFRKIDQDNPTLLLDEIDAIFGSATDRTEPLRAMLNAGNRPGSAVARCVGEGANQTVMDFSVYCPKVLAGIDTGRIPDTIVDRSVRLAMKRKTGDEPTAALRHRHADAEARPVRDGLGAWGAANAAGLLEAEPSDVPAGLDDRAAEAWEPLFAIADLAGDNWPARARAAAVALIGDDDEPTCGPRLLAKEREVFAEHEVLATTTILERVNEDEELPFGGWRRGEGLDARGLSRLLKPYAVRPRSVRIDGAASTSKGYRREQFEEAFTRYLPPTPQGPAQAAQAAQSAPRLVGLR